MKGIRIFVDNTHTTDNYAYLHNKNFNTQKCDRWHDSCLLEKSVQARTTFGNEIALKVSTKDFVPGNMPDARLIV